MTKAADTLHLTPQTVSGQLTSFEESLGAQLFDRQGKRLILNELGHMVQSYAEDIFSLGSELKQAIQNRQPHQQRVFTVGIVDVIPKVLAFNLLKPCFDGEEPIRLVCQEGDIDSLLADLAISNIDLIISDQPLRSGAHIKAYNHLLIETGVTFYAEKRLAKRLSKEFPYSLDQQPFLMGGDKSNQKINLISWFDTLEISPQIVAEFDDSALLKFFAQAGIGAFCSPSSIEPHILEQYKVVSIGRTTEITERFYAITPERKLKHPNVKQIIECAHDIC